MNPSNARHDILVYGACGHTGRFIVAELIERGYAPVAAGRDAAKLDVLAAAHGGLQTRVADVRDRAAVDRALAGVCAVINAAGPFAATAAPLADAAIAAGVPYLDVAAEPDVAAATIERSGDRAARANVPLALSVGFYGGLGDLLATVAMGGRPGADEIALAYYLSSWQPTSGTRATIAEAGERRGGRRLAFRQGRLELRDDEAAETVWSFPAPLGRQPVAAEFTTADAVTMSRHLRTGLISEYMTSAPLQDLGGPLIAPHAGPAPAPSSQVFVVDAVVRTGTHRTRVGATGRDIYAITAPLVVEALHRLLAEPGRWRGAVGAGQIGCARTFLEALTPRHLTLDLAAVESDAHACA